MGLNFPRSRNQGWECDHISSTFGTFPNGQDHRRDTLGTQIMEDATDHPASKPPLNHRFIHDHGPIGAMMKPIMKHKFGWFIPQLHSLPSCKRTLMWKTVIFL
jgi:hypothetical protein